MNYKFDDKEIIENLLKIMRHAAYSNRLGTSKTEKQK